VVLLSDFTSNKSKYLLWIKQEMQEALDYIGTCRRKFKPYNGTIIP
jgi:hypothetical protein